MISPLESLTSRASSVKFLSNDAFLFICHSLFTSSATKRPLESYMVVETFICPPSFTTANLEFLKNSKAGVPGSRTTKLAPESPNSSSGYRACLADSMTFALSESGVPVYRFFLYSLLSKKIAVKTKRKVAVAVNQLGSIDGLYQPKRPIAKKRKPRVSFRIF